MYRPTSRRRTTAARLDALCGQTSGAPAASSRWSAPSAATVRLQVAACRERSSYRQIPHQAGTPIPFPPSARAFTPEPARPPATHGLFLENCQPQSHPRCRLSAPCRALASPGLPSSQHRCATPPGSANVIRAAVPIPSCSGSSRMGVMRNVLMRDAVHCPLNTHEAIHRVPPRCSCPTAWLALPGITAGTVGALHRRSSSAVRLE